MSSGLPNSSSVQVGPVVTVPSVAGSEARSLGASESGLNVPSAVLDPMVLAGSADGPGCGERRRRGDG